MIFVTVGNMDPFDRLIKAMDEWIAISQSSEEVFAQIGTGSYQPMNCKYVQFLTPSEYRAKFELARLVVSHAGMGTIITALELGKPIVIMPKRATLGEQRNDHQLATVLHFKRSKQILVAESELELPDVLDDYFASGAEDAIDVRGIRENTNWAPETSLIKFVRDFIS